MKLKRHYMAQQVGDWMKMFKGRRDRKVRFARNVRRFQCVGGAR